MSLVGAILGPGRIGLHISVDRFGPQNRGMDKDRSMFRAHEPTHSLSIYVIVVVVQFLLLSDGALGHKTS